MVLKTLKEFCDSVILETSTGVASTHQFMLIRTQMVYILGLMKKERLMWSLAV